MKQELELLKQDLREAASVGEVVEIKSIDRSTLPNTVADRLCEMIIEGALPPGMRLNERALCDRLQVSRTPLREAFRLLSADGLIEIQPNRGAQVVALSREDVVESFEVMGALEALSGQLACERITPEEVTEIRALTFEMQASHSRRDLPSYYQLNRQIHDRINAASHNALLTRVYKRINLRMQNLRFRSNLVPEKWDAAMREHLEMVKALEARDAHRLSEIMMEHLRHKLVAVLDHLEQRSSTPDEMS